MAIAEVGAGTQRQPIRGASVDSTTAVFPANVTAGSLLIATGASWQSGAGNSSIAVTDTLGTTYTTLLQTGLTWAGGVGRQFYAYGIAPSSGACTVTINPSGVANYINGVIDEFSGTHATTPFDVDGGQTTGTTSDTTWTDTITTVTANDLLVAVAVCDGTCTLTAASGCTMIDTDGTAARQPYGAAIKIIAGAATTETVEIDSDTARNFAIGSAAFREPGAAPSGGAVKLVGDRFSLAGAGGGLAGRRG